MFTRHLTAAATAVVLSTTTALAQTTTPPSPSFSAPVTATVASRLSMTSSGATSFGSFNNSAHTEFLNPVTPGAGKTAALFTVIAEANRTMVFTCANSTLLTATTGAPATMPFTPSFATSTSNPVALSQISATCANFSTQTSTGNLTIALGGSLVVGVDQQFGSYVGTFTLTVNY